MLGFTPHLLVFFYRESVDPFPYPWRKARCMEDDDPIVQKKFVENLVQMQRTGLMTGGLQDISDWLARNHF